MVTPLKAKKRILTLDLMRGYFILIIIIDHLERWPGIFDWITGQGRLWVSAAEGFILLSGVMIGLIRGRKELHKPMKEVSKKILKRSFILYIWAIITALLSILIVKHLFAGSYFFPYPPGTDSFSASQNDLYELLTFRAIFGWSIYLQVYAVFLFFSPFAVWLLRKGKWKLLLAISVLIWAVGTRLNALIISWQLLFFIGVVIGFYFDTLNAKWHSYKHRRAVSYSAVIATLITVVISTFVIFAWTAVKAGMLPFNEQQFIDFRATIDPFFLRQKFLPLHMILTFLWIFTLYILVHRFEGKINKWFGWLLVPFGQNSLFVYIVQGFVIIAASTLIPHTQNMFINAAIIASVIMIVWGITFIKPLYKIIPR